MLRYLFLEMFGLRLTTPWFYVVYGDVRVRSVWEFHPQTPSPLRGGLKWLGWESGDASLPDSCFFMLGMGDVRAAALRPA